MLAHPLHVDPVTAIGQHVAHGPVGRHLAPLLIDDDAFERLGELHGARIRLHLAGQQLEQGRLARAVLADDADAVAPRHAQGEIGDDRPLSERLRHMLDVDDDLAARIVAADRQVRGARRPHHRSASLAHLEQFGQAALVALAPPSHAAQQPMLLQLQLGVELLGVALFLGIDRFRPCLEPAETDFRAPDGAAIEPQGLLGQPGQEGAIVADGDECTAEPPEPFLQPVDRGDVEMVGRLVKQQHVRFLRQRADNRRTPPLPARRRGRLARQVDAELIGDRLRLILQRRIVPAEHVVAKRREAAQVRLLFEQDDARAGLDRSPALVGVDLAGDQLQQGRLARAVAPDQRQPVARTDMHVEPAKEPAGALDEAEIFECEDWCCHVTGPLGGLLRRGKLHAA